MGKKQRSKLILTGWIALGILGILLFSIGLSGFIYEITTGYNANMKILFLIAGIFLIGFSMKMAFQNVVRVAKKKNVNEKISRSQIDNILHKERVQLRGPKIVVVGGGTGLSVLLRGLKEYTSNLTAIVTVADDGGGSGVLREDLNMLPPGDIRACILALANTEPNMEKLLEYRFEEGDLKGQNFGNLFIAAMNGIYGNFETAIRETSNVLAVTGKVLPMTLEDVVIYAELENGSTIKGESEIPIKNLELSSKIERIYMEPKMSDPLVESVEAIKEADIIVLGPGSLYTSVIPNLLVNNIIDTIHSAKGKKVYITNVMTQPGETNEYTVLDHINGILAHSKEDFLDYVVANVEEIPVETLEEYISDGSEPVFLGKNDEKTLNSKGIRLVKGNLVEIKKDYIRHDSTELSRLLIEIADKELKNKIKKSKR